MSDTPFHDPERFGFTGECGAPDDGKYPMISIVIPVYNEVDNLLRLYEEIVSSLESTCEFEVIFVDDGSTDGSWGRIRELCSIDGRARGIRFSRNFGHQYALFSGLSHAEGMAIVTMDADLQHPPSLIPRLIEEWKGGSKIVNTVRIDNRNTPLMKRWTSKLFYKVFTILSGVELSEGMADFRLLDRQVARELLNLDEAGLFLRGLVQWVGFPCSKVQFPCQDRYRGKSKYTFLKMVKFAWRGISSFSIIPLRIGILLGILTSLVAFYQLAEALYAKLISNTAIPGWASMIGIMSLLFGVLFILIGLIGEYLGRVLIEVRGRPRYVIMDRAGGGPAKRETQTDPILQIESPGRRGSP